MIAGNDRVGIIVIIAAGVMRIECAPAPALRTGGVVMNDLGKGDLIGTSHLQGGKGPIEIGHLGGHGRPDHGDTGTGTIVCVEYSGLAS